MLKPALFAVMIALAMHALLTESYGITPDYRCWAIPIGELTAAYHRRVFCSCSMPRCWSVPGPQLMQSPCFPVAAMIAVQVQLSADQLQPRCSTSYPGSLAIAAINRPAHFIVSVRYSGPTDQITQIGAYCAAQPRTKPPAVTVSHAFHSAAMSTPRYHEQLERPTRRPVCGSRAAQIPLYSPSCPTSLGAIATPRHN